MDIIKTIENLGIVPVIVINDPEKAVPLAKALIEGGVPCAEVTFRTAAAEESIRRINEAYPEMILGAGTVITTDQAERAVKAGAKFLVSPGYDQTLVDWAKEHNVPYTPGVATASELQVAVASGLNVVKFFPAEAAGGVNMIKNLCGPFPQVKFMTTGGISMANLNSYASCPSIIAIGGSWMAKGDMIANEDWATITKLCREAVTAVHGFTIKHWAINCPDVDQAQKVADAFAVFGFDKKVGGGSTMVANAGIEVMHSQGRGTNGHIAIGTYNVERAVAYLQTMGLTVEEGSQAYDAKGKMKICYFKEAIGGFAIHLLKY